MTIQPNKVQRLLLTSGKHYYTLNDERNRRQRDDIAIIRVEELCPFPVDELRQEMKKYPHVKEYLWCQEEHRNQGAWSFVRPRFENILGINVCFVHTSTPTNIHT
jgi:probable 2-oxoglutarate dehydrogenase E1 component DHKTD1